MRFHLYKPMTVFKLVQVNHLFQRLWIHHPYYSFTQSKNLETMAFCWHAAHTPPQVDLLDVMWQVNRWVLGAFRGRWGSAALGDRRWTETMRSEDSCTFTVFLQRLCVSIEHPAALWLNAALTAKRWAPHAPLESRLKLFTRFIKSEIKAWRVGLQTGFISENSSLTEPFVGVIVGAITDQFL